MYDVIGDIHGHADALRRLLHELGYGPIDGVWRHPDRTAVFVGDFVDRGPAIREVLQIVRPMVDSGAAQAVMGNHEFNAVAFHRKHPTIPGEFLREHSDKNIRQCAETIAQLTDIERKDYTAWFQTLPMWLDLGPLRVVHACWDRSAMGVVGEAHARCGGFSDAFFQQACDRDDALFGAVEVLLKGKEVRLPDGLAINDKDGNPRTEFRTRWFAETAATSSTYRDYAFTPREEERARIPDEPLSSDALSEACPYGSEEPPVLFGHYWMPGDLEHKPLAKNVACLDYSVARGGRLCAYRWDGEKELRPEGFVSVPASTRQ